MSWLVASVGGDDEGAVGDDGCAPAGLDQGRRVGLLDDRRTANLAASSQHRAIVNLGGDEAAAFGGKNVAHGLVCAIRRVVPLRARRSRHHGSADRAAMDAAEIDDAGWALGAVAVDAVMR